jgi:hypothetical protein
LRWWVVIAGSSKLSSLDDLRRTIGRHEGSEKARPNPG